MTKIERTPKEVVSLFKILFQNEIDRFKGDKNKEFLELFRKEFGEFISERAVTDLKMLFLVLGDHNQSTFNFSFLEPSLRNKLKFCATEAIRCRYGLNRDGKDFYEFHRYSMIIIENLLLYYFKKLKPDYSIQENSTKIELVLFSIVKETKPFEIRFKRWAKNNKNSVEWQDPDLAPLISFFLFEYLNVKIIGKVIKDTEIYNYCNNLNQLRDIRNISSHTGTFDYSDFDKYTLQEIKNNDFDFVQRYVTDVYEFVRPKN
jgi:hypothetical protein